MAEARTKVPDSQANAAVAQPGTMGICLSGGGIRAAAFGLGALQSMQEHGILTGPHKADYLAAVSGGSYIATAVNLVARGGLPGEPGGEAAVAAADPFARGTPEEQYLRDHTTYLVHGPGGRLVYAGRVVGGILLNVLFLALLLHLVFRPAGWVYGAIFESLRRDYGGGDVTVHLPTLAWLVPLVLIGLGLLLGLVQIAVRWDSDAVRQQLVIWCSRLLKVGIVVAIVVVGIPNLLELIRDVVARLGGAGGRSATEAEAAVRSTQRLGVATGGGLAGAVATALWALRARAASASTVESTGRWLAKKGRALALKFRVYLQNLLATIFGPLLLLSLAVFFLNLGAANTVADSSHRTSEILWVVGLAILLGALYYFADLVSWSIQPLYKRRLSASFALRRVRRPRRQAHGRGPAVLRLVQAVRLAAGPPAQVPHLRRGQRLRLRRHRHRFERGRVRVRGGRDRGARHLPDADHDVRVRRRPAGRGLHPPGGHEHQRGRHLPVDGQDDPSAAAISSWPCSTCASGYGSPTPGGSCWPTRSATATTASWPTTASARRSPSTPGPATCCGSSSARTTSTPASST